MRRARLVVAAILLASQLAPAPLALAQVPPHRPGTICFTPQFWCWANPPGNPGNDCYCPTPYGLVKGRYG